MISCYFRHFRKQANIKIKYLGTYIDGALGYSILYLYTTYTRCIRIIPTCVNVRRKCLPIPVWCRGRELTLMRAGWVTQSSSRHSWASLATAPPNRNRFETSLEMQSDTQPITYAAMTGQSWLFFDIQQHQQDVMLGMVTLYLLYINIFTISCS